MRIICTSIVVLALCGITTGLLAELAANGATVDEQLLKSTSSCESCSLATADGGGPYACPLFPIMTLSSGTIYYCDYFEPDCDAETQPAYLIGEYDYPAFCPECVGISSGAKAAEFAGMEHPVAVSLSESHLNVGTDIQRSLHREGISFADSVQEVSLAGLVRLSVDGDERVAIVLRVDFSLRCSQPTNSSSGSSTRYVGIESDGLPNNSDILLTDAISPQELPGGRAYRARFNVNSLNDAPLLILLAR